MTIYIYGIVDADDKVDESIKGLEGADVYFIPYYDIGVIAGNLEKKIQKINADDVLVHEEVIEKLATHCTVLPLKFLTMFNTKEDVLGMMKDYYPDFKKNLTRLRNKVEFGVKVIWPGDKISEKIAGEYQKNNSGPTITNNSPGGDFVKKKFEQYKIEQHIKEEANRYIKLIDNSLSKFACEKKLERLKSKNLFLNAYYLVDKNKQNNFKKAFEELRSNPNDHNDHNDHNEFNMFNSHNDLNDHNDHNEFNMFNSHNDLNGFNKFNDFKYLLSGPWPPYNFIILTEKADPLKDFGIENLFNKVLKAGAI